MNTHRSILLAASLSLAACAETSARISTGDMSVSSAKLSVHIVEADGAG